MDKIMKNGGWKMESIAEQYIGATSGGQVYGSKRRGGQSYADVSELPLTPDFFAACAGSDRGNAKDLCVRRFCA